MTEFFEKVKDVITETAKDVSKKTGEVVEIVADKAGQTIEITKLKNQIRVLERSNDRDYKHIGKMIYHKYTNDEEIDQSYVELCDAITERKVRIAELKEEIAEIKGEND